MVTAAAYRKRQNGQTREIENVLYRVPVTGTLAYTAAVPAAVIR